MKKPKIKPRVMWGVISAAGRILDVLGEEKAATEEAWNRNLSAFHPDGNHTQRVLVTAPPKQREKK